MLKFNESNIYSDCLTRKHIKVSHLSIRKCTISKVLELLHLDLMGPMQVQSLDGKRYACVCVDDYSRYTWVKFLLPGTHG